MKPEHLPSQVIISYSGKESRLCDKYYFPFYQDYIKEIMGSNLPNTKLVYINKYYWSIALLTLHFYDFIYFKDISNFCKNILNINIQVPPTSFQHKIVNYIQSVRTRYDNLKEESKNLKLKEIKEFEVAIFISTN